MTDQLQPAALESVRRWSGEAETSCQIQTRPDLFTSWLHCSPAWPQISLWYTDTLKWAEVGLMFPVFVSLSNISPRLSDQISKRATFSLWLYNFNLVWHSVCAEKKTLMHTQIHTVEGVSGYLTAASGMVFYAWLALNGVHTEWRALGVDVLTWSGFFRGTERWEKIKKPSRKDMITSPQLSIRRTPTPLHHHPREY